MKPIHWISLIILATISGSSFIFTRALAPVLGAIGTADLRLLLAGLSLIIYATIIQFDLQWRQSWSLYLSIGIANSGLPFLFYSFAALELPAAYLAIINASSPLFGALFSAIWLEDRLTSNKLIGLLMGMVGVGLVSYNGAMDRGLNVAVILSIVACVAAAACYALSGVFIKKKAKHIKPLALAACSQLAAGILMAPLMGIEVPPGPFHWTAVFQLLALSLLCSAVAYLIYFRLMAEIGPTRTLTVTFLSPIAALVVARIFLGEAIKLQMITGMVIIAAATLLVNRSSNSATIPSK
ncbi:DMT family transporter [Verminephrobacter aporrectodeae subsp. tuberculatae]|uniref:DMT family transporter n=1 Tax=Verminephrobacter aporrectodeae TaxID=1110389 RepID=UPI0022434F1E|nr:DMT family transporter [Verminephrobacter aporrectodeae]MCW8206072.1 DMT family transporter [Verminephrobacter aporrectodeae subsp. tuberculatae]